MRRLILLSVLGCVAIMPLLILPALVSALVDSAALSEQLAGWTASVGALGGAFAAIVIAWRIHHIDLRRLGRFGLFVMCAGNIASSLIMHLPIPLFLGARFVAAIGGGMTYAAVISTIAAEPEPDRGYGVFMVLQFILSGAALYLLPRWAPAMGIEGIFLGMAALNVMALPLAVLLVRREAASSETAPRLERDILLTGAALCAALGIGLFEAANMAQFTYADRLGTTYALTPDQVGTALGIASLAGIPGAAAVVWVGKRFGRFPPVAAACGLELAAFFLLMHGSGYLTYFACMCVLGAGWAFGLPYIQSIEAGIDPGGSVVVLGGFFTALGDSLGPGAAAMLVRPGHYDGIMMTCMVSLVVVIILLRTSLAVRYANA